MSNPVHAWQQTGRVFAWRYPPHKKKHYGWHITADHAACDSLVKLVTSMRAEAQSSRRTVSISAPTAPVWSVPNFREPVKEQPRPLTVDFDPDFEDLVLTEQDDRLRLQVGEARADEIVEAIKDLKNGGGDYCLLPRNSTGFPIWIWWML
jgi:hypothetical protein